MVALYTIHILGITASCPNLPDGIQRETEIMILNL
jgi:hypothetical protein